MATETHSPQSWSPSLGTGGLLFYSIKSIDYVILAKIQYLGTRAVVHSKPHPITRTTPTSQRGHAPHLSGPLRQLLGFTAIAFLLGQPVARAQTDNAMDTPFKALIVVVGGSVTYDSNLFRNPGLLTQPQSDTITSGQVGLRFDKPYALQHFRLDITQSYTRYNKFKYLDFDALNYSGAWTWKLGTRVSGKLSASRAESLAPFEDTLGFGRNVRINQNQAFDLDGWIVDGWHLLLGVSQADQKSEQNLQNREPDFRSTSGNLGVKYLTRAGNSITVRRQSTDGEYIDRPVGMADNGYTEDLSELSADWKLSGTSALNGRLGWLERTNNDITRRNFAGPSSSLTYSWKPPGKLSLSITASKQTSPLQDLTASYREQDSLAVTPTWRIRDKTSAYLRLSYQTSNDRGILIPLPSGPRSDTTSTAAVGMDWSATPKLTFNASVQRQQRTSTSVLAEYESTVARINASFAF